MIRAIWLTSLLWLSFIVAGGGFILYNKMTVVIGSAETLHQDNLDIFLEAERASR